MPVPVVRWPLAVAHLRTGIDLGTGSSLQALRPRAVAAQLSTVGPASDSEPTRTRLHLGGSRSRRVRARNPRWGS